MSHSWRSRAVVVVVAGVTIEVSLTALGMGPSYLLMSAILVLIAAVVCLLLEVGDAAVPAEWPNSIPPPARAAGTDWRVGTLRMLLMNERRSDSATSRLYDVLVGLIDDRLMAEHRVDRSVDPGAARRLIGPELATFVEDPPTARRLADPRLVTRIVTLIENL